MKIMFGRKAIGCLLKYNALSGLKSIMSCSAGLHPTLTYNIPSGLNN